MAAAAGAAATKGHGYLSHRPARLAALIAAEHAAGAGRLSECLRNCPHIHATSQRSPRWAECDLAVHFNWVYDRNRLVVKTNAFLFILRTPPHIFCQISKNLSSLPYPRAYRGEVCESEVT